MGAMSRDSCYIHIANVPVKPVSLQNHIFMAHATNVSRLTPQLMGNASEISVLLKTTEASCAVQLEGTEQHVIQPSLEAKQLEIPKTKEARQVKRPDSASSHRIRALIEPVEGNSDFKYSIQKVPNIISNYRNRDIPTYTPVHYKISRMREVHMAIYDIMEHSIKSRRKIGIINAPYFA